ncbi:ATP-binding protein [Spiroplasma endosymbiont of Diplazon laetatorius]|uniref:ATP-binding protein n=1 Tax=Spiroplasma endosymbiont of Diplazon laetatorius TaxID=3066322 RepID=UPI0030D23B3A
MENKYELDFRPDTSIYATYKRLSYTQPYALAEFVDNSTASFFEKKAEIQQYYKNNDKEYKLKIYILYTNSGKDSTLQIVDNAYGMELENFKRAVILGKPPKNKGGRNEFGMGLKTAATWFSDKWTVESSKLGSKKKYRVVMDIEKISKESPDFIPIDVEDEITSKHYTKITLENLNKPIRTKNQKENLVNLLTGIYRRDIRSNDIQIVYAELKDKKMMDYSGIEYEKLSLVPALKFEDVEPRVVQPGEIEGIVRPTVCTKTIDGSFEFEGEIYPVKGFVGIRKEGSRSKAGFTLFRRGRAIIGGFENNYRPKEVFGDQSSFSYQRLYGELDLDTFPANQAKDGFSWDDGLEDAFKNFIARETAKLKSWSMILRKVEPSPISKISSNEIKNSNDQIMKMLGNDVQKIISANNKKEYELASHEFDGNQKKVNDDREESVKELDNIMYLEKGKKLKMTIDDNQKPKDWITIKRIDDAKGYFEVVIHIEHQFFKPYTEMPDFIIFIKTFSFAYVAAIIKLRTESIDSKVDPLKITKVINSYLLNYIENN